MKKTLTQKKIFSIGILVTVLSIIVITACKNPADNPVCECTGPQYLPCSCGRAGCDCTHIPYDYITDLPGQPEVNIPIYFQESVVNMREVADNVIAGYRNIYPASSKNQLEDKIKEIRIIQQDESGGGFDYRIDANQVILSIRHDISVHTRNIFLWLIENGIVLQYNQSFTNDTIRLAKALGTRILA